MKQNRTLVIGDIHGGLKALKQLLERLRLTKDDQVIFLGDYVDGWSESAQVIQYLIELSKTNTCVFIKGNHDAWCEQWLASGVENRVWLFHGGMETIESYKDVSEEEKKTHLNFFEQMPLYHVDAKNRMFVHAGFTSMHGVEKEVQKENCYFDRTLWEMARILNMVDQDKHGNIDTRLSHYHEIYIGHTPTINFDQDRPMRAVNLWNVDTGAAFTGKLSAIDLDTKEVFQSDEVMSFYPDEKGRNASVYNNRINE